MFFVNFVPGLRLRAASQKDLLRKTSLLAVTAYPDSNALTADDEDDCA